MTPANASLIDTQTYSSLLKTYTSAVKWLEKLGLNIHNKRVDRYGEYLEHFTLNYDKWNSEEIRNNYPNAVNVLFETMAIIGIYESLKNEQVSSLTGVIEKLKKAINGPDSSIDETHSNQEARNFLFEAHTVATIYHPDKYLFAIFNSPTDTAFTFMDKTVFIECKRIHSADKLEKNIRKACNQLKVAFSKNNKIKHRGLVAIEVSKPINPDFNLLVAPNDNLLIASLNTHLNNFINKNYYVWNKVFNDKSSKIIGILVRISYMGVSQEKNLLVT